MHIDVIKYLEKTIKREGDAIISDAISHREHLHNYLPVTKSDLILNYIDYSKYHGSTLIPLALVHSDMDIIGLILEQWDDNKHQYEYLIKE